MECATVKLRAYQETGADFLYVHDRAMVLAPVGAGKTALTITAMADMLRDGYVKRFLVLAPKRVAQHVWPAEVEKWGRGHKVAECVGEPARRKAALETGRHIVVANYDTLQWLSKQPLDFDGLVCDELTRLKNPSGKRFKALLSIIQQFKVRWGLTGSFTSNGLEDVFGQCKIIDQSLLGRAKGAFLQEYFVLVNKDYGEWAPRPGALAQVMARIKPATFVLEPGVYTDTLPPLHTVEMRCDMPVREPYEKMKKDFAVEFPTAHVLAQNAAVVTGKLQQLAAGFVYDTVKAPTPASPGKWIVTQTPIWLSDHKLDLLEDILAENQRANTLIAYTYQEELAALQRRYPHLQTLDSPDVIARWNAGQVPLLAVHPKSAGHGLNLQFGGCNIIFFSLPWSLELYEQTIGRLHRSGQKRDVWCYVLLTNKTVDEKIWAALHDKRAVSDIAMEELK
jgi:hypothetical protein